MTQCAKIIVGFMANVGNVFIKRLQTVFFYIFHIFTFFKVFFLIFIWMFITCMASATFTTYHVSYPATYIFPLSLLRCLWFSGEWENEKSRYHSVSSDGGACGLLVSGVWDSAAGVLLRRVNLLRLAGDASSHTSDARLELSVLGGVDERVDATADVHHHQVKVVEPADIFF